MHWVYLLIAGFFEVAWAVGLKLSNGFTNITISVLTILGMILSFYFLALALKNIPLGTLMLFGQALARWERLF